MNNATTGMQVINYVRDEKQNFTEILFYSANEQLKNQKLINSNRITYFQLTGDYKDLRDAIENLIKLTIQKFQHIVAMRGMIMHETSGLDVVLSEIAKEILQDDKSVRIKDKYPNYDVEPIKKQFFESIRSNAYEKCKKSYSNKIKDVLKDDTIFSAGEKNKVIGYFIDELVKNGEGIKNFTKEYKDFINIRNNFAHAELKTKDGRQFFQKGDITFDEDKCREIRKDIITHKENIKNLQEIIESFK